MTELTRKRFRFVAGALFAVVLGMGAAAQASAATDARVLGAKDVVLKGDAVCTRCHDENEEYPVLSIAKTKHGTVADSRTPTCITCHGESDRHVNKPENVVERPKTDRVFGKLSHTPMAEQSDTCLGCHQSGSRIDWDSSIHAARDISCTSCHQVHNEGQDKVRNKSTQAEVCMDCHQDKRAQLRRPSRHPVLEGKVLCSDCHNAHGSAGPSLMTRDTVNDTCYTCHAEKRGPFLRAHQPVTEDCSICHNPHGTINAAMLKMRSPFLCQQCHEPTSHRGYAATLDGTQGSTRANTLARGCLNCHTNIHGTNNPTDDSGERSFRR